MTSCWPQLSFCKGDENVGKSLLWSELLLLRDRRSERGKRVEESRESGQHWVPIAEQRIFGSNS